jgi:hypothetical protein
LPGLPVGQAKEHGVEFVDELYRSERNAGIQESREPTTHGEWPCGGVYG